MGVAAGVLTVGAAVAGAVVVDAAVVGTGFDGVKEGLTEVSVSDVVTDVCVIVTELAELEKDSSVVVVVGSVAVEVDVTLVSCCASVVPLVIVVIAAIEGAAVEGATVNMNVGMLNAGAAVVGAIVVGATVGRGVGSGTVGGKVGVVGTRVDK